MGDVISFHYRISMIILSLIRNTTRVARHCYIHCIPIEQHSFAWSRNTLQGSLIHPATLSYCKSLQKWRHECEQMVGLNFIVKRCPTIKEEWCNDKINQDLIYGPIWLLTTSSICFQGARNWTEPQVELDSLTDPKCTKETSTAEWEVHQF